MRTVTEPRPSEISFAGVMAALSDPVRVAIVRELAEGAERACGTFDVGVAKATRSHHFRVLREAGLTHTRPEGTHRFVRLRRACLDERFPGLLDAVLAAAARDEHAAGLSGSAEAPSPVA
jgi:DNA-binding transcriptional ArsR family regulator